MAHKDYLKEINPYILFDGLINMERNSEEEQLIYYNLIKCIDNNDSLLLIQDELDLLLNEVAKNYFCKGYKMALELSYVLGKSTSINDNEEC